MSGAVAVTTSPAVWGPALWLLFRLGLVWLACWALTFKLVPWGVVGCGRALGFAMQANPLTQKRLRRFRQIRRGYGAFVFITAAFVASFFLELYVNNKPLYIRYGDKVQYPAVASWADFVLPFATFNDRVVARDYGVDDGGELDCRRYARWVHDPATLEEDAREIEKGIVKDEQHFRGVLREQAAGKGLVYDPAEPLPDEKLADYEHRRAQAAALRAFRPEFEAGKASIVMPIHPYSAAEQLLNLDGAPPHEPFRPNFPILGTDADGKDVLSQILYGFRVSFAFALCVAIIGYAIGVLVGGAMGYFSGWFDILVQRVIEVWSNIPFLFTMMIIASVWRRDFWTLTFMLVALSAWTGITYTVRGEFYRERTRDYVQAARALGVGDFRIMVRHILPNALVPVVTFLPFAIVGFMSALVSLDFLGFGLPPGTPSWGTLLRQGSDNIKNHPQLVLIPVIAFAGTLFCVVLIGEAVREAFDPKTYARLR